MAQNYYDTLGVDKNSSQDDIKKAFRKHAHKHHPDKSNGNEAKFKEINEAYQTLKDPDKRKQYDTFGSSNKNTGGSGGGFNWSDYANQGGNQYQNVNFDFGDIFGDFFGGGSKRRSRQPVPDIHIEMTIDFMDSVKGPKRKISFEIDDTCSKCNGQGGTDIQKCKTCDGKGQVMQATRTILGNFQTPKECSDCNGKGSKAKDICSECNGKGIKRKIKDIEIQIPPGIETGQSIRLTGQGNANVNGSFGDIYINFKVMAHEKFIRHENDIYTSQEISFSQAALGDTVSVDTVDGQVDMKIPSGIQSGQKIKLKNLGIPYIHKTGRGDQLVEIKVNTPKKLNKQQKKLFKELLEVS